MTSGTTKRTATIFGLLLIFSMLVTILPGCAAPAAPAPAAPAPAAPAATAAPAQAEPTKAAAPAAPACCFGQPMC